MECVGVLHTQGDCTPHHAVKHFSTDGSLHMGVRIMGAVLEALDWSLSLSLSLLFLARLLVHGANVSLSLSLSPHPPSLPLSL